VVFCSSTSAVRRGCFFWQLVGHFYFLTGQHQIMVLRKTSRYQVYAVAISYVSLGASVAELALFLTAYDLSLSLYGVALMAITDISGDLLILTQWQGRAEESSFTSSKELREARTAQQLMEVWASFTVGIFLFICALFLLADSIKSVVVASRQSLGTDEMGLGMAASVLGVICGSLLSAYKFKIARELESSTVLANAISSQCSAMTGAAAIVSALLDSFWSSLDSVLGAAVASYTLHQGRVGAARGVEGRTRHAAHRSPPCLHFFRKA
jgi:Cation efflux family